MTPAPAGALVGGAVVGLLAAAWGAARGVGLVGTLVDRLPQQVRRPLRAGALAAAVVLLGSAALVAVSLVAHAGTAGHLAGAVGGGAVGGTALVGLDLALLPNAAGCAAGYVVGPGCTLGAGGAMTMGSSHVSAVPALPLLAAVPHGGAPAVVVLLAVMVLVAAGAVAGWKLAHASADPWWRVVTDALGAGAVAGVVTAFVVAISDGAAGPGRMSVVGASPWQVGLMLAGEVAVVGAVTAAARRLVAARR